MTMRINRHLPMIGLTFLVSSLIFAGCTKDDNPATTMAVTLLSFGPAGVQPGEEIRFIGQNLDKVTAVEFAGSNAVVEQSAFSSHSKELITLTVPQSAERGRVTLRTPEGDIVSKSMFDMGIGATVSAITQEARPGATITLNGTFLNWVNSVTFTDNQPVTEFESQTFDELVIKVPEEAQTGPLTIAYSGTEAGDFETGQIVTVTLPVITAMDPEAVRHEQELTLTGTDLDLARKVFFSSVTEPVTEFISQSATTLKLKVPGGATKGPLTLEAASGVQTISGQSLDIVLPQALNIAPASVKHGENITITGTDLDLVRSVFFTNEPEPVTTFVSQSATKLVVKVPGGAKKGVLKLAVASGVQSTSATSLELTIPLITLLTPNPVAPLSELKITGSHLDLVTLVQLENVPPIPSTSFLSQSATQIRVTVPAGTANGKLRLGIMNATVLAESEGSLEIAGAAPPPQIGYYVFNDNAVNGFGAWGGWGSGNSVDLANTSPVRIGDHSIKVVIGDAWGAALQLGGGVMNFGAYTMFKFSVYCTPEAVGKRVSVRLIDPYLPGDGDGNANTYEFTFGAAGQWHDVSIPLANFSKASAATGVKEVSFQQMDGNFTVYFDEIGFN